MTDTMSHSGDYNAYIAKLAQLGAGIQATDAAGKLLPTMEAYRFWIGELARIAGSDHNKVMFVGNGGSAGISSHCAIDYTKNGRIRSQAFNDAAALTCLSNDYSYDDVFAKQIDFYGFAGDLLIAISSSGKSANILKAVDAARARQITVVTLSGFSPENPLRRRGDMNFFVEASQYGWVEILHLTAIHAALDMFMASRSGGRLGE